MTGEQLKDELDRIAEAAPEIHVPDDLFDRGQRAVVRTRLLVGAAAVACIALVAAVTAPFLLSDHAQVADGDGGRAGVPDVIYTSPDGDVADLPESALDDIGPLVAAYRTETGEDTIVVVDTDGQYLTVRLPDAWEPGGDEWSPLLSPDGRQLAYASLRNLELGVSIVDLTSGEIREVSLGSSGGALAITLQWSPDGRWLAWSGQMVKEARENGASFHLGTVAGLIAPDTTRSQPAWTGNRWQGLGVCNDGTALRYVWPVFFAQDGANEQRLRSWSRLVQTHGSCSGPRSLVSGGGRLLGWLEGNPDDPSTAAVVQAQERVALVWPGNARKGVVRIEVDSGIKLTLATGLMTADEPTVPAGANPWDRPWIVEHWLALLGFVAVGAVTILILVRTRAVRR